MKGLKPERTAKKAKSVAETFAEEMDEE